MYVATRIGGDSRFVARSAARLFLHSGEPLLGLRALRGAAGAKSDPWLLAAEIAVSSASGFPSLFAKLGRNRLEDSSFSRFESSELASAVGTLELENGKARLARQHFRESLIAPNDNSLAQAEWARRLVGDLDIRSGSFAVPRSFEALAYKHFNNGHWEDAARQGINWLQDQQFSRWPAVFTSYVSSLNDGYDRSVSILEKSLRCNPADAQLLNNLAFALASSGKVLDAQAALQRIQPGTSTGLSAVTLIATEGLVLFRSGFVEAGRQLYVRAAEKAQALGHVKYRAMAALYLAREEILAGTTQWEESLRVGLGEAKKSNEPDVKFLATRVEALSKQLTPKAM